MSDALKDVLSWLEERQDGVPAALRTAVFDTVKRVGRSQATPEAILRDAADQVLAETVRTDTRTNPVRLLAADALITYVCEYRSESRPEMLETLL